MENESEQAKFVKSTARVSAGTLTSRLLGMARMSVMSGLFGASDANDAFVAAFKIPNMLRDMFAEGALSAAFIPVFTSKLKDAGRSEAFQTANTVLSFLMVTVGLLVVIGILVVPSIVSLLAPGFEDIPGKFDLTVLLGRIMMPFLLIVSVAALFMGMLNSLGKFGTPAFAPALLNIGMIAAGFVLCPFTDPPILGMAIGVLAGGFGQCVVQFPQLRRDGFRFKLNLKFNNPEFRQILKLMAPMVVGLVATQINVFVITNLASRLAEGAVSYLDYAYRLLHLPLGLFGVAIATVSLPSASRLAADNDMQGMAEHYVSSLKFGLFLILPAQAVLLFGGEPIVALLYQHSHFTHADTVSTASALAFYAIGLFAYSGVRITVPIFYAMKETRIPVAISVASVVVNIALCLLLVGRLDFRGLCLAVACSGSLNFLLLFAFLCRKVPVLSVRGFGRSVARIVLPAVGISILLIVGQRLVPVDIVAGGKLDWLAYTLIMLSATALVYLLIAKFLRITELSSLIAMIRKTKC
jgi:putative peptidoglycan lipid II flippase